jgi:hypothetical protein
VTQQFTLLGKVKVETRDNTRYVEKAKMERLKANGARIGWAQGRLHHGARTIATLVERNNSCSPSHTTSTTASPNFVTLQKVEDSS